MTNPSKQQQPQSAVDKDKDKVVDPFELTETNLREWLCGPIERFYSSLESTRKKMVDNKVPEPIIAQYFFYEPTNTLLSHHYNVLESMTNPRTLRYWSLESLKNDISPEQADNIRMQDNYRERPYYYIYQIRKVADSQNKQYLVAAFLVEGLTREAGTINDSGYIGIDKIPRLKSTFVSSNPTNQNSKQVQVTEFNDRISSGTFDGSITHYTLPWSVETFYAMLMHTQPVTPDMDLEAAIQAVNENKDKVALSFHKEGVNTPSAIGIETIDQFVSEDVETAFKRYRDWETKKTYSQQNFTMTDIDEYVKWKSEQQKKKASEEKEPYK